jgi:hypothetical protein
LALYNDTFGHGGKVKIKTLRVDIPIYGTQDVCLYSLLHMKYEELEKMTDHIVNKQSLDMNFDSAFATFEEREEYVEREIERMRTDNRSNYAVTFTRGMKKEGPQPFLVTTHYRYKGKYSNWWC